ncbi:protein of unknown function [Shewanella benthica]|uniref:Uncharacterized protein n=1 Tax=Shewanella benthica TaxID=43661 RepID=A0A330MBE5_9GAMM|nr:protein of unknown function [Shewanella benthica]
MGAYRPIYTLDVEYLKYLSLTRYLGGVFFWAGDIISKSWPGFN